MKLLSKKEIVFEKHETDFIIISKEESKIIKQLIKQGINIIDSDLSNHSIAIS